MLIDTPGEDTSIVDPVIALADLVISPIQPSKREVLGAIDCFESVTRLNEALGRACRHGVLRTRITVTVRHTELYRKIRPIIDDKVGTYLFRTEVFERNVYKDIHNGIGTLQMQEVTEAIRQGAARNARAGGGSRRTLGWGSCNGACSMSGKEVLSLDEFATAPRRRRPGTSNRSEDARNAAMTSVEQGQVAKRKCPARRARPCDR